MRQICWLNKTLDEPNENYNNIFQNIMKKIIF